MAKWLILPQQEIQVEGEKHVEKIQKSKAGPARSTGKADETNATKGINTTTET